MYLELSQGETPTGADTAVVLDRGASDDRSQLVDRPGSEGGSLGLADLTAVNLLGGLVEVASDPTLPILAEVYPRVLVHLSVLNRFRDSQSRIVRMR